MRVTKLMATKVRNYIGIFALIAAIIGVILISIYTFAPDVHLNAWWGTSFFLLYLVLIFINLGIMFYFKL